MRQIDLLKRDYRSYVSHLEILRTNVFRKSFQLFFRSTFLVVALFRMASINNKLTTILFAPLYKIARMASGIQIPRRTRIGGGLLIPHYGGVVINKKCSIGENCTLLHNVTLAARGVSDDRGVPVIGDNVYLGAGSILLGSINVGDNSVVAAGAVVTRDVPQYSTVAGNPARPIKTIQRNAQYPTKAQASISLSSPGQQSESQALARVKSPLTH